MKMRWTILAVAALGLALPLAFAQDKKGQEDKNPADEHPKGTLHLQTNLGSFRILPGTDERGRPTSGKLDFTFTGTVVVSHFQGALSVTGNVRKEFEGMERTVYHGTGRMVAEGRWRAIQWFGSDMKATWYGFGIASLDGEFDRNLKTGTFWYDDPTLKSAWMDSILELRVPEERYAGPGNVKPRERGTPRKN